MEATKNKETLEPLITSPEEEILYKKRIASYEDQMNGISFARCIPAAIVGGALVLGALVLIALPEAKIIASPYYSFLQNVGAARVVGAASCLSGSSLLLSPLFQRISSYNKLKNNKEFLENEVDLYNSPESIQQEGHVKGGS